MKKILAFAVLLVVLAGAAWLWWAFNGGVSHGELKDTVEREAREIRSEMDLRCDALGEKLDRVASQLDRVESKLDRLIEMATPRLPDGLHAVE